VVLLHGGAVTSITWQHLVAALPDRDIYALDTMGDVGRSEQAVRFDEVTDLADWLDDTLGGLGLEGVQLVGHSAGGWVAINAAIHRPRRLASLVLIDPAGVVPLQMRSFAAWGVPVMMSTFLPVRARAWVASRKRHPLAVDWRWTRMMLLGLLWHRPGFPALPPLFVDADLATITLPTTVVVGERTEMLDVRRLAKRLSDLVPNVTTTIVEGAGHALTVSHAERCAAAMR
jgi:pimeloyl-ACP methyl ester carboxylesterase